MKRLGVPSGRTHDACAPVEELITAASSSQPWPEKYTTAVASPAAAARVASARRGPAALDQVAGQAVGNGGRFGLAQGGEEGGRGGDSQQSQHLFQFRLLQGGLHPDNEGLPRPIPPVPASAGSAPGSDGAPRSGR